jgi:hypothetical protein
MNDHDLFHFDAHFRNVLTDGDDLYFADLGLATSTRFDLDGPERAFLSEHLGHDIAYAATQLVNWLVTNLGEPRPGPRARNAIVGNWVSRRNDSGLPDFAVPIVTRLAPIAAVMNAFYWDLHTKSRATPYPRAEIELAIAACGLRPIAPLRRRLFGSDAAARHE